MNVIHRELRLFTRSGGWLIAIIFPIVMVISIGLAISGDLHSIPIGICGDPDVMDPLTTTFTNDSKFSLQTVNFEDIPTLIRQGKLRAAVVVISSSPNMDITVYIDATDSTLKEQLKYLITTHIYDVLGVKYDYHLNVETIELYSGKNFFAYIGPGILALSILGGGLFGASETILKERDNRTLENVILSGFNPTRFIAEKIISFMISMSIIALVSFLLVILFTGLPTLESLAVIFVIIVLAEFIFVSLGVALSTFCPNEEVSGELLVTIQFPLMFLSAAFVSIYQMNPIIIPLAQLNPLTHIIEAFRGLLLKQTTFSDLTGTITYLTSIGSGLFLLAVGLMYRIVKKIQN